MKELMISIVTLLGATVFVSCNSSANTQEESTPSPLIINMTSDATLSAHSALMGIHLAEKALNNGLEAVVFLNVSGVKLLQPGADTLVFHGENILQALKQVVEKGGDVRICPHCADALGIDRTQIPTNFNMQDDQVMMEMLRNNPTVFTY